MESTEKTSGRIGRPRAFDPDRALDQVMRVFWQHGYEATSVAMLCEATGLTRPQLYNFFVDKETLFRRAVDRYAEEEARFALNALAHAGTAREAIALLLHGAAVAYTSAEKPQGCLFVTGALSGDDETVATLLAERRRSTREAIKARLWAGAEAGEFPVGRVDVLARMITGVIHGMSIQARDGATATELRDMADFTLRSWPERSEAAAYDKSPPSLGVGPQR